MPAVIEDTEVEVFASSKQNLCPNYHVMFLNDDHHTFGFVIAVITTIFRKQLEEAYALTLQIHHEGQAVITTCSKERAELYLEQVSSMREGEKGPIYCVMEPAE